MNARSDPMHAGQENPAGDFQLDRPLAWVIALAILAHLPHMPFWSVPVILGGLIWRLQHEWRGWPLPPKLLLIFLALLSGLLVLFSYHSLWGRDAGVALLTIAATLKLLETEKPRDQQALLLLGFFLIVALLLFDQGFALALLALLMFGGLVTAWIGVSNPTLRAIKPRLKAASVLMVAGLPVAIVLFVVFPRPPGALWGAQQPTSQQAQTGLSDTLNPGQFEQLASDATPAFRVTFDGPMIPPAQRYWRVLVMSTEQDGIWHADSSIFPTKSTTLHATWDSHSAVQYTITLEPAQHRWLPALALAVERPSQSVISETATLFSLHSLADRYRYTVTSDLTYQLDPNHLSRTTRTQDLAPPDGDPKLKALAATWRGQSPIEIRDKALDYFRTQGFSYTLTPGRLPDHDAMDAFLFTTKRGYCEHYASAFTLLMRAAGVPARIVTGYQGGERVGDYLLVRQADAHAWSEIWIKGRGWIRVDPTAVVAPERIAAGIANATRQDDALPASLRREAGLGQQFALFNDQLQNGWNQYVLGYSGSTQSDLLGRLGLAAQGLGARFGYAALVLLVVWSLVFLLWRQFSRPSRAHLSPADQAWYPVEQALTSLDVHRFPDETLSVYCQRASQMLPGQAATIEQLHKLFSAWFFAAHFSRRSQKLAEDTAANFVRQANWTRRMRRVRALFGMSTRR